MKRVDLMAIVGRRDIIAVPMIDEFRDILNVSEFLWDIPAWSVDSGGFALFGVSGTSQVVVVLDVNNPDLAIHLLFNRIMILARSQPKQALTLFDHASYRHLYPILPRCIEIVSLERNPVQLTLL